MKKAVSFYSEGVRLVGDIYYPDDMKASDKRAGIVLCHGYTGVKDMYPTTRGSSTRPATSC